MKLEDQCCSLDLAKRLKELGVKQNGYFSYFNTPDIDGFCYEENWISTKVKLLPSSTCLLKSNMNHNSMISAFTVAELGEMLPKVLRSKDKFNPCELTCKWELHYSDEYQWHITYRNYDDKEIKDFMIYDTNEANVRAKMLIHLIENKLIEVPI